jgi:hypothetical protein
LGVGTEDTEDENEEGGTSAAVAAAEQLAAQLARI